MKESVLDVQVVVVEEELSSMEEVEDLIVELRRDMDLEVVNMVIMVSLVLSSYMFELELVKNLGIPLHQKIHLFIHIQKNLENISDFLLSFVDFIVLHCP